ncbi:MAG: hypothetical protein ABSB78_00695 [Bacteroidota bacterium]
MKQTHSHIFFFMSFIIIECKSFSQWVIKENMYTEKINSSSYSPDTMSIENG